MMHCHLLPLCRYKATISGIRALPSCTGRIILSDWAAKPRSQPYNELSSCAVNYDFHTVSIALNYLLNCTDQTQKYLFEEYFEF